MLKLFSAPIFCGIVLGVLFPYLSLSLIWVSSILLFLLLFLNTLAIDKKKILTLTRPQLGQIAITQGFIFLFIPLVATALASVLVRDPDFVFGFAVSTLAPCALVNPFFASKRHGEEQVALWNVLISTLLCPLATVPLLKALQLETVFMNTGYLTRYLLLLTVVPLIFSALTNRFVPSLRVKLQPLLPLSNSFILAALMFILVGSSLQRVPLRLLFNNDFYILLALFIFFDFGLFTLIKVVGRWFMSESAAETLALSVATRNFAVSASLMLLFHPKAAIPSAIGMMVHCAFFQYLLWNKPKV